MFVCAYCHDFCFEEKRDLLGCFERVRRLFEYATINKVSDGISVVSFVFCLKCVVSPISVILPVRLHVLTGDRRQECADI